MKYYDAIHKSESNRGHDEEIDGRHCIFVVFDKRLLGLPSWPRMLAQILTHRRLRYPESKLE
jgi:hypothetical protein